MTTVVGCVRSHIAWREEGNGSYIEDLNSTLSSHFFKGIWPIEKQNRDRFIGSHVCVIVALDLTISGEKLEDMSDILSLYVQQRYKTVPFS